MPVDKRSAGERAYDQMCSDKIMQDFAATKKTEGAGASMKSYVGAKIIQACPMDEVTFLKTQKGQETNQETRPGYMVIYPEGYKSWSPRYAFEQAYREISRDEKVLI